MRDPKRIPEMMKMIEALWLRHPDLRFGQLLSWINRYRDNPNKDPFYVEDEEWKQIINWLMRG